MNWGKKIKVKNLREGRDKRLRENELGTVCKLLGDFFLSLLLWRQLLLKFSSSHINSSLLTFIVNKTTTTTKQAQIVTSQRMLDSFCLLDAV